MSKFVHLHLHTQYSLLDGVNKIPDVLKQAHKLGQPAIAMTDHGNMHGAIEFFQAAKKTGIKPIIGCELYVNPVSRHERKTVNQGGAATNHLTVLAKNQEGYKNLCKLVTLAYKEGFYFKPRVDHEILEEYSKGLIVLSGCMSGELSRSVNSDKIEESKQVVEFYSRVFGDDYYLEVQPHSLPEQNKVNQACLEIGRDLGVKIVATTDCHYPTHDHHFAQEVLMCISTAKNIHDPTRLKHDNVHLHLKTQEEMLKEFGDYKYASEAISNTLEITDKCNIEFDFDTYYMPKYETKEESLDDVMLRQAKEGLERRIRNYEKHSGEKLDRNLYNERLAVEAKLIVEMGFSGYFLVVADFINWAKENDIPVGPGRGSAAGSIIAWAMNITEIDSIKHKCIFERFLNPERVSLPDIDVDFCIHGRDKVIKYVVEKYGAENVAQIATFGTLKAKATIKDVGRALGISYAETDKIAQLVPAPRQGFDFSLKESLKMEKRLKEYADGEGKDFIELALKLEGLTRHFSTHAAGVVIGHKPLDEMLPMMIDKDGKYVTQFSMKYVEKIGLVKFDFLGLKTLTVIKSAVDIIKESKGIDIDVSNLNYSDSKTYELLCAGNVTGIFQLEGTGIREVTMRLKPSSFEDIVAIGALYRPGPLDAGMVDHYIERKHGREKVSYLHDKLKEILSDTYGIIVYQEQILKLAQELAGYSLGEADLLRRAMGKKVPEEMAQQRERFLSGVIEKGIDQKTGNEIFDQMEKFARYGFNRSHSVAYATITFQTAYLKAHHRVEFMAALMSQEMGDSDKTLKNLTECKKQNIKVLPPDINESLASFAVVEGKIRFGLTALKGVGHKSVDIIVEERNANGAFKSFEDFVMRVSAGAVNKKVLENLVKSGSFESISKFSRRELFDRVEDALKFSQSSNRQVDVNQIALFDAEAIAQTMPKRSSNAPEWPINKKLSYERDALGFYISGHPLDKFQGALNFLGSVSTSKIRSKGSKTTVKVGGVVTALKLRNTRKGDRYANFTLEDFEGTVETLVWPDSYVKYAAILTSEDPVLITAKTDITEERCVLMVDKIESLIELRDRKATKGVVKLTHDDKLEEKITKLVEIFKTHSGNCPVEAIFNHPDGNIKMLLKDSEKRVVHVNPSEMLCEDVEKLFGSPVLSFR